MHLTVVLGASVPHRVIGYHDALDEGADLRFPALIRGFHEHLKLLKEGIRIKGDRVAYMYQMIRGHSHALLGHEFFLIELFAGAQSRILDLDIDVGAEARESYQVPGEGIYFYGRAHIQNENLAALCVGSCLQDERGGFGYCHKVSDDIGVGDGDGAAFGDLLFKARDDRAVTAEHVTEADCYKLGPGVLRLFCDRAHTYVLVVAMDVQRQKLAGFTVADLTVEGLYYHFAEAFGGAHDICGVDCLIGGDQDEAFTAVGHSGVGGFICTDRVILDRLAGAVFHEGDMFMCGGVVHDVGFIGFKDLIYAAAVADRADEDSKVQIRELILKLKADSVGIIFVDIEDYKLFGIMGSDLAAKLAADRAASAGDEDRFTFDEGIDLLHIDADGVTAEEVLDGDLFHLACGDLTVDELIDAGEVFQDTGSFLTDIEDIAAHLGGSAGDSQKDLFDLILIGVKQDIVSAADDRYAVDKATPFTFIVVDDTADAVVEFIGVMQVAQDHLTCGAGADKHYAACGLSAEHTCAAIFFEVQEAVGEADDEGKHELNDGTEDIV